MGNEHSNVTCARVFRWSSNWGKSLLPLQMAVTYAFVIAAFVWSLGAWWASDTLQDKNPKRWSKKRTRGEKPGGARRYALLKFGVSLAIFVPLVPAMVVTHYLGYAIELRQMYGVLIPANDPTPINPCGEVEGNDVLFLYGETGASRVSAFPHAILNSRSMGDIVAVNRRKDGSIIVNMSVLDPTGKIIVQMDDSGFSVNHNAVMSMMRPDKSTLTITGEYPGEKMDIRYLNKNTIRITGFFHYPGHPDAIALRSPLIGICPSAGAMTESDVSIP